MKKTVLLALVLWLLSTALFLCVVGLLELQIAYASPYTSIDVGTAYNMITNGSYPDLVVLDVRTKNEYDSRHIYGAVWIPVSELEARIGELAGHENHEMIVYCASGGRSLTASGILDSHNFTKVYNMLGGISAWESAGYPVWIATVHNVNTTFNYDTIQAAIDAPKTLFGHTILVDAGTYYEHVFVIKPISLIGENRSTTVIDGNGTGSVIKIIADHVNVTGFTIRNGTNGVYIETFDYNIISGNIVTDNQYGIHLFATCPCNPASENTIRNNVIKDNSIGILLRVSQDNVIYHNNFINNTASCSVPSYENLWDFGYPSGGNYWSDYNGTDLFSGPYQDETGSDGIGDTPHIIDENNRDRYPLMYPWNPLPVHNINTGSGYATIQEAINVNETLDGHVIFVETGTYSEHVTINKSISLIGESRSNTIIDGNGTGTVVHVTANNTFVKGFTIQNSGSEWGVDSGISLENSSNCSVFANNVNNNWFGVFLNYSSNCSVSDNNVNNNYCGILLFFSSNNFLRNNTMVGNSYNFYVFGESLQDYIQDIDVSNTVNGKPVYYLVDQNGLTVNPSTCPHIGYLALVNSTEITVEDLTLTKNGQGVLLAYTTESSIKNITAGNDGYGIMLYYSSNCSLSGNNASNNHEGIALYYSSNCSVSDNNVNNNGYNGITLWYSSNCSVSGNNVNNNDEYGISLGYSSSCCVSGNNAKNNPIGIGLDYSSSNTIYHNNFINNTCQVSTYDSFNNTWDDGYPSGGNYWSDYPDVDVKSGPNQDQPGSDGIGDTTYHIDGNNPDNYPLMGMFSDFNATSEHHVQTICNSSISDFQFNGTAISFNVSGENGTTGFCRICIPTALMNDTYKVFVNGTEVPHTPLLCSNSTHSYLYFTYNHSTQEVIIIPEFPIWTSTLLILIMLTVALTIYKRRLLKPPIH